MVRDVGVKKSKAHNTEELQKVKVNACYSVLKAVDIYMVTIFHNKDRSESLTHDDS